MAKNKKTELQFTGIEIDKLKNGFMVTSNYKTSAPKDYRWEEEKYFCETYDEVVDKVSEIMYKECGI